jgi:hypothetical protein
VGRSYAEKQQVAIEYHLQKKCMEKYESSPPQGSSRGRAGQITVPGKHDEIIKEGSVYNSRPRSLRPPRGALRGGGRCRKWGLWRHQPPSETVTRTANRLFLESNYKKKFLELYPLKKLMQEEKMIW